MLRSGRSTPVCMETGGLKEVVVTQKPAPQRKTKVKKKTTKKESSKELVKQEGDVNSDDVKPILLIKIEEDLDVHIEKNVTTAEKKNEANTKNKKQRNKAANQQPKSLVKAGTVPGIKSVKHKGGKVNRARRAPNSRTQKVQADSSNVPRNKRSQVAKTKRLNIETTGNKLKKVSAIEKLKVRAFDQLKEKLEIAIDRSSLSVPECAKLLQQITSPNLSEIFYSQPASVDEVSSESLVAELAGKSFPEIMSDRMQKVVLPITKDSAVNLSEAAQALVSFKTQTASATSRMNLDQEAPLSHEINHSSSSVTQTIVKGIQNNGVNARFPEHQFVKNNIDDQFDNAISAATHLTGVQLMKSQELQSNNNPVSGSNGISDPHMKSSNSELSTVGFSPSSPFLPVTNQLLQQPIPQSTTNQLLQQQIPLSTTNPLVPATNQFVHLTNPLTPTTNQDFSTINSLLTTTNQAPSLTNSSIPTTNQVLSTINTLLPTVNQVPSSTNPLLSTTNRLVQTNHLQTTINPLIPTTNQLLYNFPSASGAAETAIVAISPVVQASNVLPNQPQLTFQLLPPQGIIPTQPTVMTTSQTQATPRSSTATSTTPNRPTTLLTTPLNHLFLPRITPPIDQKTLGSNLPTILPGIKTPHDLLLPKTVSAVTQQHAGTVAATSANDMPPSCKLRPILPRQPLVSPTFTLTNPPQSTLKIAGNTTNVPNNVKKAVRRFVSGRTKNYDLSTQQTTSLPDIASTFNKGIFTGHVSGPAIVPGQSNTEMANKEQAIKALLSIGSGQQKTARQEAKGVVNVATSRASETNKPNDLLVVFDTNKEIFKVDDVIIDPQVNTIGKGNYFSPSLKFIVFVLA